MTTVLVPGFLPSIQGFHFSNSAWPRVPDWTIDLGNGITLPIGDASNGMCGGMTYAVRDLFEANRPAPSDRSAPSFGPVFDFIASRLMDSFNVPGGPALYLLLMSPAFPDHDTWIEHGRAWRMINVSWPTIKAEIDAGTLSPISLVETKSLNPADLKENHQVLAYGYDLNGTDLSIRVYDPNHPDDDTITLALSIADPLHTTVVTYSDGSTVWCFFRSDYSFRDPITALSLEEAGEVNVDLFDMGGGISKGWSDFWSTGWTSLVPFIAGGQTYLLSYKFRTGEVNVDLFDMGGGISKGWSDFWSTGWTSLVPFTAGGQTYLLSYKVQTGEVSFDRLETNGSIKPVWQGDWSTGWTRMVPFIAGGQTYLLSYKVQTGEVDVDRLEANGRITPIRQDNWSTGWTHMVPFILGGQTYLLSYKVQTGEVDIDRLASNGGISRIWGNFWNRGWTSMVPFIVGGQPYLLSYKVDTGEVDVDRFTNAARLSQVWSDTWSRGWTSMVPFTVGGETYLLSHK